MIKLNLISYKPWLLWNKVHQATCTYLCNYFNGFPYDRLWMLDTDIGIHFQGQPFSTLQFMLFIDILKVHIFIISKLKWKWCCWLLPKKIYLTLRRITKFVNLGGLSLRCSARSCFFFIDFNFNSILFFIIAFYKGPFYPFPVIYLAIKSSLLAFYMFT